MDFLKHDSNRNTVKTITVDDVAKYGDALGQPMKVLLIAAKDHNYTQLAAEFNIPVGTVKSRLSRARAFIAKAKRNDQRSNDGQTHP